jgi:RecG-like helicase
MLTLFSPINELPKVGIETTKSLKKLGVETVQDLLFYFPYKYLDFSKFSAISSIKLGEVVTIKGVIKTIQARYAFRSRLSLCEAVVSDDSGSIKVVWFNQPYLAKTLKNGDEVLLSGKAVPKDMLEKALKEIGNVDTKLKMDVKSSSENQKKSDKPDSGHADKKAEVLGKLESYFSP